MTPGVARPRRPRLARHAPLQLGALRLPRGREPLRDVRLRVAALPAGARPRRRGPGAPARRGRAAAQLPLAQAAELLLRRAEAPARLRGLVQHARQRGPGDDRGRHGPRAPAVQRRRRPPAPRDAPRLRRPPAGAALPPHVPLGPDARRLLPRLLAGLRPPQPDRPAAGGGDPVGAAARPRGDPRLRRLAALPGDGGDGPPARSLPALRPLRRLPPRAARQGRPAAGRGLGRARGLDRQLLPPAAPEAVRLQPVHRRDPEDGPGADRRAVRRPGRREALRGRGPGSPGRRDGPLLEPGAGALRGQPAVGGRGGRRPARRPVAGHLAPLRPVSRRPGEGSGGRPREPARVDGPLLPGQRALADAGAGAPRPRSTRSCASCASAGP